MEFKHKAAEVRRRQVKGPELMGVQDVEEGGDALPEGFEEEGGDMGAVFVKRGGRCGRQ